MTHAVKELAPIYSVSTKGKILRWIISVNLEDGTFWTTSQQLPNGKISISEPTYCEAKRGVETDGDQALKEASAKHKKRLEKKGFLSLEELEKAIDSGNTAHHFEPMLAKPFSEKLLNAIKNPLIQPKLDGMRCVVSKKGAFSRRGKPWLTVPHIFRELRDIVEKHNLVLDGELYNHDLHDSFEEIASITKRTKVSDEDLDKSEKYIRYYVYDAFFKNEPDLPYSERLKRIEHLLLHCEYAIITPTVSLGDEFQTVDEAHAKFLEDGYEGAIVRNADAPYENKRSSHLLKLKSWDDDEFTVLDIIEGQGNKVGLAASALIDVNGKQGNANIKGNHAYLAEVLKNRENLIGKPAKVQYFGIGANGLLRFPYVLEFDRNDK